MSYRSKFNDQRSGARKRNIDWDMTFQEWMDFWGDDIELRGPLSHQLCMGRYNDTGPYCIGNVYKCTVKENGELRQKMRYEQHGTYNLNHWRKQHG